MLNLLNLLKKGLYFYNTGVKTSCTMIAVLGGCVNAPSRLDRVYPPSIVLSTVIKDQKAGGLYNISTRDYLRFIGWRYKGYKNGWIPKMGGGFKSGLFSAGSRRLS